MDPADYYYCRSCDKIYSPVLITSMRSEFAARFCVRCDKKLEPPFDRQMDIVRLKLDRKEEKVGGL